MQLWVLSEAVRTVKHGVHQGSVGIRLLYIYIYDVRLTGNTFSDLIFYDTNVKICSLNFDNFCTVSHI